MKALSRLRTESFSLQKEALFGSPATAGRKREGGQEAGGAVLILGLCVCVVLLGALACFLR